MTMTRRRTGFVPAVILAAAVAGPPGAEAGLVTFCGDLNIPGDLRNTINAAAPGDTISFIPLFACTTVLDPLKGPLVINKNLTIAGNGPSLTVIDGALGTRVLTVNGGISATISGVTIQRGQAVGPNPLTPGTGGGLQNLGTLTLTNSAINGNTALAAPTGLGGRGGGIDNVGTLALVNSTVSTNIAAASFAPGGFGGIGGGIANSGTLTVTNSTISGNTAASSTILSGTGGGILNSAGTTGIVSSTLSANSIGFAIGFGQGSELARTGGSVTVRSSIVAGALPIPGFLPVAGCSGAVTSLGHNLDSGTSCGFAAAGDLSNMSPALGILKNNGGPTATMALLSGSPAIDGGDPTVCPATDQRGVPRLDGGSGTVVCDMGAYEFRTPIVVTGTGSGGGAHVRVFSASSGNEVFGFLAYNPGFTGGVRVAVGDVNGDGYPDVITGAGPGGGPHVQVFDGLGLLQHQVVVLSSFMVYDPAFSAGIFVAAADLTGDGKAEVITGAGAGGGPHVRVFDALAATPLPGSLGGFFAYSAGFTGGVFVAGGN